MKKEKMESKRRKIWNHFWNHREKSLFHAGIGKVGKKWLCSLWKNIPLMLQFLVNKRHVVWWPEIEYAEIVWPLRLALHRALYHFAHSYLRAAFLGVAAHRKESLIIFILYLHDFRVCLKYYLKFKFKQYWAKNDQFWERVTLSFTYINNNHTFPKFTNINYQLVLNGCLWPTHNQSQTRKSRNDVWTLNFARRQAKIHPFYFVFWTRKRLYFQ